MRKNRKLYRAAAALMTAAMLSTMGGMTALADNSNRVTSVPLTKTIEVASNSDAIMTPNVSFNFKVEPVKTENKNGIVETFSGDAEGETIVVYGGTAGGAKFADGNDTISFTNNDNKTKNTSITLDSTVFGKPGVYRYEITEAKPTEDEKYDGMDYSDEKFFLDLYVENGDTADLYVITAVKVWKAGDGKKEKTGTIAFTNKYTTNKLSLTKVITGNQADKKSKFEFTIEVDGVAGEQYKTNYEYLYNGEEKTLTLVSGTEATIELGQNEKIEIYGLSSNDSYTISENQKYKDDGYTTTITGDGEKNDLTVSGSIGTADKAVIYTNTKSVITPTGIMLSYGPYILLVLAAGACAVVFFRRRREDY